MNTMRLSLPPLQRWVRQFRRADYNTQGKILGLALLVALSLVLRASVVKAQTADYFYYVKPWLDYLHLHGLHSFHDNFANYNTPYLILLWIGSLTHLPDIVVIKGISVLFDLIMASAVGLIVGYFRPAGLTKYVAAVTVLYLPTVFIDSSLWGQCDSIYASFILFAFYASLKDRANLSWLLWGAAFAFKLQSVFVLPYLIFITLHRRWKLYSVLWAGLMIVVLSILPILEGRSVISTLDIYLNQTKNPGGDTALSFNAATLYQWLPQNYFATYFKRAGTIFAASVATAIMMLAFRSRRYRSREVLMIFCMSLFAIPFVLPQMHERYFYLAEVTSLIVAFVVPRMVVIAVAAQIITVMSYVPYLSWDTQNPPIPFAVLSLGMLAIIGSLGWYIVRSSNEPQPVAAGKVRRPASASEPE
jgi:Gpi18-like mannosyltransferase